MDQDAAQQKGPVGGEKIQPRDREAQLRDEKAQLRDEKAQLRHKEAQLRDKENMTIKRICKAEESSVPPKQKWLDARERELEQIERKLEQITVDIKKVEADIQNMDDTYAHIGTYILEDKMEIVEKQEEIVEGQKEIVEGKKDIFQINMLKYVGEQWRRFVGSLKEWVPLGSMALERCTQSSNYNERSCGGSSWHEDIEFMAKVLQRPLPVKIPLAEDVFALCQDHNFAAKLKNIRLETFSAPESPDVFKLHPLRRISEKFHGFLIQIKEMKQNKTHNMQESAVQNLYRPLYELLYEIILCVIPQLSSKSQLGESVQLREMQKAGASVLTSTNFIRPEKKLDFSMTAGYGSKQDVIVVAACEVKASPSKAEECVDQLKEALGGVQWIDYLYYGVQSFIAFTADSESLAFQVLSRKPMSDISIMADRNILSIPTEKLGIGTVHACLAAMLYNYYAFVSKIKNAPEYWRPYILKTRNRRGKIREHWIGGLTSSNKDQVVIRTSARFAPWVEKIAPLRKDLLKLYKDSASDAQWSEYVVRQMKSKDATERQRAGVFDAVLEEFPCIKILRLQPVGVNPMATVETSQDVLRMAQHVLSGLQFLHKRGWVHCDVRFRNVIRTSQNTFVLIDLEMALPIEKTGVAIVPYGVQENACKGTSRTKALKFWRPSYDLKLFVSNALFSAVCKVHDDSQDCCEPLKLEVEKLCGKKRLALEEHLKSVIDALEKLATCKIFLALFAQELEFQDRQRELGNKMPLTASVVHFVDDLETLFQLDEGEIDAMPISIERYKGIARKVLHERLNQKYINPKDAFNMLCAESLVTEATEAEECTKKKDKKAGKKSTSKAKSKSKAKGRATTIATPEANAKGRTTREAIVIQNDPAKGSGKRRKEGEDAYLPRKAARYRN